MLNIDFGAPADNKIYYFSANFVNGIDNPAFVGVVAGYKDVEDGVVGRYKKIEGKFVKAFLTPEEELVQE